MLIETENRKLLLRDLCARLPYGVVCKADNGEYPIKGVLDNICKVKTFDGFIYWDCYFEGLDQDILIDIVKPYLRPMSSMTKEEKDELESICNMCWNDGDASTYEYFGVEILSNSRYETTFGESYDAIDWLTKNGFDYHGLIEKGLALPMDELRKDLAKEFLDALLYDNDYINRITPLDKAKHYGDWIGRVAEKIYFPDGDKGWWLKDDRIDAFAIGDYDDKEGMIKEYPELRELDTVLNDYYDYLGETFRI